MMKNILVPLFGIDSDGETLRLAKLAAAPFGAHIDCLHVRPGPQEMAMATANVEAVGAITQQLWDSLEEEDRALTARAHGTFEAFRSQFAVPTCEQPSVQSSISISYREVLGDRFEQITIAARCSDLTVLGRGDAAFTPQLGEIGNVLMRCGRPVLLSPMNNQTTFAKRVAIAWKDSPEPARAVTAAMPFILKADKVIIIAAIERAKDQARTTRSVESFANALKWHGLQPGIRIVAVTSKGATQSILDAAQKAEADLLVVGAYGHSRLEEFIFGGVTHDLLSDSQLPVFLFH
jgi:nucleotide-binding universal stress UspA family protein